MENKYKLAIELGSCDNAVERQKIIDRVSVLLKYRGSMAQQILDHINSEDKELIAMLEHMYNHYDDLIKQSLAL
jgi:ubiquinone biosynthesis protein COQ9